MSANSLLIIDDDEDLCQLLSEYLGDVGYNVDYINTGKGAVQRLKATRPNGVILDLMLPGSNGIDVLKEVRAVSDVRVVVQPTKAVITAQVDAAIASRPGIVFLTRTQDISNHSVGAQIF